MNKRYKNSSVLIALIIVIYCLAFRVSAADVHVPEPGDKVTVGGFLFGVKLNADGLLIVDTGSVQCGSASVSPAKESGLEAGDVIVTVKGSAVTSAREFAEAVENSDGKPMKVEFMRSGEKKSAVLTPVLSDDEGKFKTGMWIRDSSAGIGTVTFTVPESGLFAGLGHGVCEQDSGKLIPFRSGELYDVKVNGIKRGTNGAPGELRGTFDGVRRGSVIGNTDNGVFGFIGGNVPGETYTIGTRNDLKEGDAEIFCTLGRDGIGRYSVSISDIDKSGTGNKNYTVTVTDASLSDKTGGIVQGMSGSPIIQNGKLVGAVTHVLVNDPCKGYGIFIDNMLSSLKGIAA